MLTWVEISTNALAHNIRVFKKLIGQKKLMAVIKSNAYGHGINLVATICARNKSIDAFGVASIDEAFELFQRGIQKPIIVLSILEVERVAKLTQVQLNQIRLPLYDFATSKKLLKVLKRQNLCARVHIKIDTGTTRIGFLPRQIEELITFLKTAKKYISFEALYTHFADAEENATFTADQNKQLLQAQALFHASGFKNFYTHSACTAGIIRSKNLHLGMVRLGLGMYGLNPNSKIATLLQKKTNQKLQPVLSWRARLIQIKTIPPDTTVGYGRMFKAPKTTTIGILPIGYYDGYDRGFSNKAKVVIHGQVCPVIGRVCMNLTMLDVSAVARFIRSGDIVTLIGNESKQISADYLAQKINTINYEIVTRINAAIARIKHN